MKKRILITLCLVFSMTLSACGVQSNTTELQSEIRELKEEIEELEDENRELRKKLAAATDEETYIEKDIVNDDTGETVREVVPEFTIETSGVCGADAYWEYGNGVLRIKGNGEITDYNYQVKDEPWYDISDKIQHVYIEDGITYVNVRLFTKLDYLSKLVLPSTLKDMYLGLGTDIISPGQRVEVVIPNSLETVYFDSGTAAVPSNWDELTAEERSDILEKEHEDAIKSARWKYDFVYNGKSFANGEGLLIELRNCGVEISEEPRAGEERAAAEAPATAAVAEAEAVTTEVAVEAVAEEVEVAAP